jgi:hypothetical protein
MARDKLIITPKTRVGEMLDAYPALEEVLLGISPVFNKLKNPFLRKTVARVATLQQVAVIGNMPVEDLVNRLRSVTGQDITEFEIMEAGYLSGNPPSWFRRERISSRFNATIMLNAGENPMNEILFRANTLKKGDILELVTAFVPAPIIGLLEEKGFIVWVNQSTGDVFTYITIV